MMFQRHKKPRRRQPVTDYDKNRSYVYRSSKESGAQEKNNQRSRGEDAGRLNSILRSAGFALGALSFLALAVLATVLGPNAEVSVSDSQPQFRPTSQYRERADEILSQSLNNRWKLSIKKSDISAALKDSFPEIETVSVSTPPWSYKPVIDLTMSEPVLLISGVGEGKYIVNEQGIAVASTKAAKVFNPKGLPEVIDQTGYEIQTGKSILTLRQVSYIEEVIFQTKQKKLDIDKILLKPGGAEADLRFAGLDYTVKFGFDNDARKSAGAFLALKKHLDKNGPPPDKYIDVRVPEQAYVR